jgi:hypothetical protein
MGAHKNSTLENRHAIHAFEYADETEREAATGFDSSDVKKIALQLDNFSYWVLTDDSPVTWVPFGNPDAMTKSVYDADSNDIVDVSELALDIDIDALDDLPSAPASGDKFMVERDGVRYKLDFDDLSTGGSVWEQVVNENGSSFANFTSGSGTWSSDGSQIKQTDTGATHRTARFTNALRLSPGFIFEAKIKAVSTGAGATHLIGLVIGYDGTNSSPGAFVELRNASGTKTIRFGRYATSDILVLTQTWNDDTYYTLKIISSGGMLTAYLDGTLIGTCSATPDNSADARYIGLCSFACEAHFDDIKGYAIALP